MRKLILPLLCLLGAAFASTLGPSSLQLSQLAEIVVHPYDPVELSRELQQAHLIFWKIRLPRIVLAMLVGAALSQSGALMQALFRNPLAEPGLLGVSSGSALGAATMILLGSSLLPLGALIFGLLAIFLVQSLGTRQGRTHMATMLLAGVALSALANALLGLFTYISSAQELRSLSFWSLGSFSGATWQSISWAGPILVLCMVWALKLSPQLNAILLGEAEAQHLGIKVQRLKRLTIVLAALMVSISVALTGVIGFVGLVIPHLWRLRYGPEHQSLLFGTIFSGALLLLLADTLARTLIAPSELPIGILTALCGVPFFLHLLRRNAARALT